MASKHHGIWNRAQQRYCRMVRWIMYGPLGMLFAIVVLLSPLWMLYMIFLLAVLANSRPGFTLCILGMIFGCLIFYWALTPTALLYPSAADQETQDAA